VIAPRGGDNAPQRPEAIGHPRVYDRKSLNAARTTQRRREPFAYGGEKVGPQRVGL